MIRDFEALHKIAMVMADTCIEKQTMQDRFDKLEEEYRELIESINAIKNKARVTKDEDDAFKGELSDVLFVLLHIAHRSGGTSPFELLHIATSKMLNRMNDQTYTR